MFQSFVVDYGENRLDVVVGRISARQLRCSLIGAVNCRASRVNTYV